MFKFALFQELSLLAKPTDMPLRIQLCEKGLRMVNRRNNPEIWADLQTQLGISLQQNPLEDRAENLERALLAYTKALTFWTYERDPERWAAIQSNIGNIYQDRIRENNADNIERAIGAYRASLTVYNIQKFPRQWAMVQNNLGNAYWKRIYGPRGNNIEKAIEAFEAALTILNCEVSPINWARAQNNLGNAYRDRISGVRMENLEKAIQAFQAATTVFTKETFPEQWAMSQNNLGIAYLFQINDDLAENMERAIHAFQAALTVFDRDTFKEQWGMAKYNLGNAYFRRIKSDLAENIELAIEAYTEALSVYTFKAFPFDWAMTQHSLGNAYRERIFDNKDKNLKKAFKAYENALTVCTKDSFPFQWATIQSNLGTTYGKHIQRNSAEIFELAIEAHKAALTVYTKDTYPEQWAGTQMNLGVLYLDRIREGHVENSKQAIQAFNATLTVYTPEAFPEEWANTQNNLGITYEHLTNEERGPKKQEGAVQAFRAALKVHLPEKYPKNALSTAKNLAQLEYKQHNWEEVYSALLIALDAAECLYNSSLSTEGKISLRREHAYLYQQMVDVCLRLDPPRVYEAFFYAEEGHTRLLRDQFAMLKIAPPPNIPQAILDQESQILQDLRNIEIWIRDAPDKATRRRWIREAASIRADLDTLYNVLIKDYDGKQYVSFRCGEKMDWNDLWKDLQQWLSIQDRCVVLLEFFTLNDRLLAFIARQDECELRVISLKISPHQQFQFVRRFYREVRFRFDTRHRIKETWCKLGKLLLPELLPYLKNAELVYIIPHTFLHEIPLHALEYENKPLIEYFPIAYAPSAAIVKRLVQPFSTLSSKEVGRKNGRKKILIVGNPTNDLPIVEKAVRRVAERLGVQPILGTDATKERILSEIVEASEVHFVAHAYYSPNDPLNSGIRLAYGQALTARDIIKRQLKIKLLTLWGCETGVQDIQPGDEREGLASAFLLANVSSLVISMWKVSADDTGILINLFFDYLYDNSVGRKQTTVGALTKAMIEMRRLFNSHTYYWAPFILYGNWR